MAEAYEEPFGNASAIPTYHCAVLARAHGVGLLLAGDGGDELFGGNERYAADHIFRRYHKIPAWLRRGVIEPALNAAPLAGVVDKGRRYVRRANIPHPDRFFSYNFVSALGARKIFDEPFLARVEPDRLLDEARAHYARPEAESEINRLLYLDVKMALTDNDLRKVAGMCESARVGVRFPYLDPGLMAFSGTIPAELKVRGKEKRILFKRAFRDLLPEEIIRKTKHGFGLPVGRWLKTKAVLRDLLHDTLTSRSARERGDLPAGVRCGDAERPGRRLHRLARRQPLVDAGVGEVDGETSEGRRPSGIAFRRSICGPRQSVTARTDSEGGRRMTVEIAVAEKVEKSKEIVRRRTSVLRPNGPFLPTRGEGQHAPPVACKGDGQGNRAPDAPDHVYQRGARFRRDSCLQGQAHEGVGSCDRRRDERRRPPAGIGGGRNGARRRS